MLAQAKRFACFVQPGRTAFDRLEAFGLQREVSTVVTASRASTKKGLRLLAGPFRYLARPEGFEPSTFASGGHGTRI